jgi:uncharacterized Zn finger protein
MCSEFFLWHSQNSWVIKVSCEACGHVYRQKSLKEATFKAQLCLSDDLIIVFNSV